MNNRQYASIWKNIIILLQLVLSVTFMMSVFLLTFLGNMNMVDTDNLTNQSFVDSNYYKDVFEKKVDDLTNFLMERELFETDGTYDSNKAINIERYVKSGIISDQAKEENIYLEVNSASNDDVDLSEELEAQRQQVEAQKKALEEQSAAEKEQLMQFEYYNLSDLVAWSKDGYVQYDNKLEEKYLPIGGMSIEDGVTSGLIDEEQAKKLYQSLTTTLDRIGTDETEYKKSLNEFDDEATNLSYIFIEDGITIYSNMEDMDNTEMLLEYAKNQGSYLYCNDEDLKFRTNVNGMEDYYYNYIDGKITGLGNYAVFVVAVDTSFVQEDDFTVAGREFDKLHPWGLISIIGIIISLLGWIVSLVYLTIAAGRVAEDDKIHLNFVDRIKTEIIFIVFVVFTVMVLTLGFAAAGYSWNIPGMLCMVGVIAFVYDAVFILLYMSMIRRMKAGVLWEYSFINWFVISVKRVVGTWRSSVRVILLFALNVILFVVFAYGTFAQHNIVSGICLILLMICEGTLYLRNAVQKQEVLKGIRQITEGDLAYKIPLDHLHNDNKHLADAVNNIGSGLHLAVEENTKNERMKADLITNVSHDIKTPLTSIINYVNLMKMEQTDNERMQNYINVLDEKSQRLRQLTEDLVEASRISSGNISLQLTRINLVELIYQTAGEFNEKFEAKDLTTITKLPNEPVVIMADGRRIWRVVENLYNNVAKYALAHTRVYVTMEVVDRQVEFSIKNISEQPLNAQGADLTERFTRGDESRTTEGSGLGLSIARNLTTIMGGKFAIKLDGDLFAAVITFPLA